MRRIVSITIHHKTTIFFNASWYILFRMTIRTENLRHLINARAGGSQAEFARQAGISGSVVYQVLNGYRNIGEKLARKIEKNLGLSLYAMDTVIADTDTAQRPGEIDAAALTKILGDVLDALETLGYKWEPKRIATLVADAYKLYQLTGDYPDSKYTVHLEAIRSK